MKRGTLRWFHVGDAVYQVRSVGGVYAFSRFFTTKIARDYQTHLESVTVQALVEEE